MTGEGNMSSDAAAETAKTDGDRNGPRPDRRAIGIAREIHRRRGPLATILFGSRARGNYDEDRSDIDILLVEDNPPGELEQVKIQDREQPAGRSAYGREVGIQLVWVTPEEMRQQDVHINSLCTRAMLEGVTISDDPERFRSRYDSPNPPGAQYDWSTYQWYLASSLNTLKVIHLVMAQEEGDWEAAARIRLAPPWSSLQGQRNLGWKIAGNFAVRAMHGALGAAIAGAGEIPKTHDLAPQHMDRLRAILPHEDLATAIPMEAHAAPGEVEPTGMTNRDFALTALPDIRKIRELAMRLRRQTGPEGRGHEAGPGQG